MEPSEGAKEYEGPIPVSVQINLYNLFKFICALINISISFFCYSSPSEMPLLEQNYLYKGKILVADYQTYCKIIGAKT